VVEAARSVRGELLGHMRDRPRTRLKIIRHGRSKVMVSTVTAVSRPPWTGV